MRHNTDRILVAHAGNLPRPTDLDELIDGGKATQGATSAEYAGRLPAAVRWIVDHKTELGVDIVNDGEYAKAGSYGGYIQERVTGYSLVAADPNKPPKRAGTAERDRRDFPGFFTSARLSTSSPLNRCLRPTGCSDSRTCCCARKRVARRLRRGQE
jgi:5-methyltetrahydropteroyltriglutamate--homocysteine methyltransferase